MTTPRTGSAANVSVSTDTDPVVPNPTDSDPHNAALYTGVSDILGNEIAALKHVAASIANRPNYIINGDFRINQRAASTGTVGPSERRYTADRWCVALESGGGGSASWTRLPTGGPRGTPCMRVQRPAANAVTSIRHLIQEIDRDFLPHNITPEQGNNDGMSFFVKFWARKGADFSGASSNMRVAAFQGDPTGSLWDPIFALGAGALGTNVLLTTTWQLFSIQIPALGLSKAVALDFQFTPVGTAGAADYFEVALVHMVSGSDLAPADGTAFKNLPFMNAASNEMALCEKFYETSVEESMLITAANDSGITAFTGAATSDFNFPFRVRKPTTQGRFVEPSQGLPANYQFPLIYSPNTGTVGKAYKPGTGDINAVANDTVTSVGGKLLVVPAQDHLVFNYAVDHEI